jgi:uncharacterized protein YqjF (DUF2071 family)
MFSFLKDHPFAVEAFFESSLVLTYAVPKEQLVHLVPECVEVETFDDQWGFVALAMVQTKNLRPKGFPEYLGNDFFLTGYRVFVRYTDAIGKKYRGLYILKSETNKRKMEFFGNFFTHYNYTTTDITVTETDKQLQIDSKKSGLNVVVSTETTEVPLPENSPFENWMEARKFAGPLPFTFTYTPEIQEVLIIEGVRTAWKPQPVKVLAQHSDFLDSLQLKGMVLANAFIIKNIPYWWKKGRKELWQP